ncbi:helix-turn-helix domain-containing protein [Enterococcus sp. LJL128]|uniref:helix-turn-helix domain-containing protein n=1 Tax=Enterococcus sp. LJL51 TaxID=3416656 RepID=UPI003CED6334
MIDLNQVLTFTEAAERWGLASGNTLRQAVSRGRFQENEIRKSGTVWLTTYEAMSRVFGPLPEQKDNPPLKFEQSILYSIILHKGTDSIEFSEIEKEAETAFKEGRQLQIFERFFGKEITLFLFSSKKEWSQWLLLAERSFIPRTPDQTK